MNPSTPLVAPLVGPLESLVVFAVSLLVGGAAIHVAANYVIFRDGIGGLPFEHAVVTALLGALTWALLAWIPLVGWLAALAGWIGVVRWRYPGSWHEAAFTGAAAWAAAVVAIAALELLGVGAVAALGVPGA